jgi:cysteate synthase
MEYHETVGEEAEMAEHTLKCLACGKEFEDDHFRLDCDRKHEPSLLRSVYNKKKLSLHRDKPGMFKFYDFLPVSRVVESRGAPVTYKSEGLARHLDLENLYVIFNGYWPEKGATMHTASFKELEAPAVLARVPESHDRTIVVASAGNTGRAFAHVCSMNGIPLVLVVPEGSVEDIWSTEPFAENVKLVVAAGQSDYYDAIHLANKITQLEGFFPEGGAKNVARRDGMATTVLDAAIRIGRIPDHYFQAIGSGTGGIAAWESRMRLLEDGGYGDARMKLHLSQNHPFVPMTEAWRRGSRELLPMDEEEAKEQIRRVDAKVLSNRKPPYSLKGGVFEMLQASGGAMYSVTNREVETALDLFENVEGIDICPAAGVAVSSLIQAVESGAVGKRDCIVVNVTGGGEARVKKDHRVNHLEPFLRIYDTEIRSDELDRNLERMMAFA